jgi:hypothetical protein
MNANGTECQKKFTTETRRHGEKENNLPQMNAGNADLKHQLLPAWDLGKSAAEFGKPTFPNT